MSRWFTRAADLREVGGGNPAGLERGVILRAGEGAGGPRGARGAARGRGFRNAARGRGAGWRCPGRGTARTPSGRDSREREGVDSRGGKRLEPRDDTGSRGRRRDPPFVPASAAWTMFTSCAGGDVVKVEARMGGGEFRRGSGETRASARRGACPCFAGCRHGCGASRKPTRDGPRRGRRGPARAGAGRAVGGLRGVRSAFSMRGRRPHLRRRQLRPRGPWTRRKPAGSVDPDAGGAAAVVGLWAVRWAWRSRWN